MHFRTPISSLYFSSCLWAFFISLRRLHIYATMGFICRVFRERGTCARRLVKLARRCFSLRNILSFFFFTTFLSASVYLFVGHANSIVNWIVSCTSNLSLIRFGKREKKRSSFWYTYINDNSNTAGTDSIKKMRLNLLRFVQFANNAMWSLVTLQFSELISGRARGLYHSYDKSEARFRVSPRQLEKAVSASLKQRQVWYAISSIAETTSDTTFRFTEHSTRYTEMLSWDSPILSDVIFCNHIKL